MDIVNIDNVIERLQDLKRYRPDLALRMEHEKDILPVDAVPFLIEKIKTSWDNCKYMQGDEETEGNLEVVRWLVKSYQFYLARLAKDSVSGGIWTLGFTNKENRFTH